jgi:hypothetical protein
MENFDAPCFDGVDVFAPPLFSDNVQASMDVFAPPLFSDNVQASMENFEATSLHTQASVGNFDASLLDNIQPLMDGFNTPTFESITLSQNSAARVREDTCDLSSGIPNLSSRDEVSLRGRGNDWIQGYLD